MRVQPLHLGAALFCLIGIGVGCSSSSDNSSQVSATSTPAASPTSSSASTSATPTSSTTLASSGAADGATIFSQNCAGCHGAKGVGGGKAPVLAGAHHPQADVERIVTDGKGRRMPAFGNRLSKDQISAVAKYVSTL